MQPTRADVPDDSLIARGVCSDSPLRVYLKDTLQPTQIMETAAPPRPEDLARLGPKEYILWTKTGRDNRMEYIVCVAAHVTHVNFRRRSLSGALSSRTFGTCMATAIIWTSPTHTRSGLFQNQKISQSVTNMRSMVRWSIVIPSATEL